MKNKNIHLIPTDKPSRLSILNSGKLNFGAEFISSSNSKAQNIYITSDEEIKEGDYFIALDGSNDIYKANKVWLDIIKENPNPSQKIILTTNQDLIKDGVQAIDDEFLEWFVKNSSCEWVEVQEFYGFSEDYLIIIPKEEPKQDTVGKQFYEAADKVITVKRQEEPKQENCCTPIGQIKRYKDCIGCDRKPKQETLEEAADRLAYDSTEENKGFPKIKVFKDGAEWQAERMYEIMNAYVDDVMGGCNLRAKEWFEQNKNK